MELIAQSLKFLPEIETVDMDTFEVNVEKVKTYPYMKFNLKFGEDVSKSIYVTKKGLYKMLEFSGTL